MAFVREILLTNIQASKDTALNGNEIKGAVLFGFG
jgi:hypothetical protein